MQKINSKKRLSKKGQKLHLLFYPRSVMSGKGHERLQKEINLKEFKNLLSSEP